MDIIRATTAGFCMGVSLALQKLEEELTQSRNLANSRICTLGPIIHNPQVLADFESKGVVCINNENEIGPDDRVLIRAHGVPQKTEAFLRTRGAAVRDATCPRVKKLNYPLPAPRTREQPFCFLGNPNTRKCGGWFLTLMECPIFSVMKARLIALSFCLIHLMFLHHKQPRIERPLQPLWKGFQNNCQSSLFYRLFAMPPKNARKRPAG